MKRVVLSLGLVFACLTAVSQENKPQLLKDDGVSVGPIEQVLPAGHFLHVRVNRPENIVKDIESLLLTFIPPETVPEGLKPMFQQPNPLLTLAGLRTLGVPLNGATLKQMLGIDPDKVMGITLYPHPKDFFILSIPLANHQTFANVLAGIVKARRFEPIEGPGFSGAAVTCTNPDLPRKLYITCSKEYAYICASAELMRRIHDKAQPRLASSKIIQRCLKRYGNDDITIIADAASGKQFLERFKAFSQIPEEPMQKLRKMANEAVTPQIRMRLQWDYGIDDIDKALDYVQGFVTAGYESSFIYLNDRVDHFHGMAVSIDLGKDRQTMRAAVFSDDITIKGRPQPLDMRQVLDVLAKLPGRRNQLEITSRQPRVVESEFEQLFLKKLKSKFAKYKLDAKYYTMLEAYLVDTKPVQPLATKVPWMVRFNVTQPNNQKFPVGMKNYVTYLRDKVMASAAAMSSYRLLAGIDEDGLLAHYQENAKQVNQNNNAYLKLLDGITAQRPFYAKESRVFRNSVDGSARIVLESSYRTNAGIFGYDEHELINRQFVYYKRMGKYLLVGEGNGNKFDGRLQTKVTPLAPAMARLLTDVPQGVDYVYAGRVLQEIGGVVEHVDMLENSLRKELDDYLVAVQTVAALSNSQREMRRKIEALKMPMSMIALTKDPRTKRFGAVLIFGQSQYPRPKIMGIIKPMFAKYMAEKDSLGGGVIYSRTSEGQIEQTFVQRTDAIAALIRSIASSFHRDYIKDKKGGPKAFVANMLVPGDGRLRRSDVVTYNPYWRMIFAPRQMTRFF